MSQFREYLYRGPVKEFDTVISNNWEAKTYAPSEKKARSNLVYRYKKEHGKATCAKITLPGKIVAIE